MGDLHLKRTPSLLYNNLSFSPSTGKYIYVHKGEIHIANAGTSECSSLQGKNVQAARVCGDVVVAATSTGVNVYNLAKEQQVYTVAYAEDASRDSFLSRGIAMLSNNQILVGHSSGAISVIAGGADSGSYVKTLSGEHKDGVTDIAAGNLGGAEVFVSADMAGEVLIWDAASMTVKTRLKSEGDTCTSVAVTPEAVACGYGSGHLRFWGAGGEKSVEIAAHSRWIQAIAYDPAANLVASVAEDQTFLVFTVPSAANKKVTLKAQKYIKDSLLTGVQFTGGKVATVAYDNDCLAVTAV